MRKRISPSMHWTCEVEFVDGSIQSVTSHTANETFEFYVSVYLGFHSHEVRAIRLYDNRHKVYKEYFQNY